MKKVLLVTSNATEYVVQLKVYLQKFYQDLSISLLTLDSNREYYECREIWNENEHVYTYKYDKLYIGLKKAINELPQFDVVHPLWMEWQLGYRVKYLLKKTKAIFTSVGGSDLYRDSKRLHVKFFQKRLILSSDYISSENEETREYFYQTYGNNVRKIPHSIIKFGVDVLDSIDAIQANTDALKDKWNVPRDKMIVVCGHNGRREHQHLEIAQALSKMNKDMLELCYFIIPMTYSIPSEEYVDEVNRAFERFTSQFVIMRNYMNSDEMAESIRLSDIMIHVQTTDQMSSTMLAYMYDEKIVIAGNWLPYSSLKEAGVCFYTVDRIDDLDRIITAVYNDSFRYQEECVGNRAIVDKLSSWKYASKNWYSVYSQLLESSESKVSYK